MLLFYDSLVVKTNSRNMTLLTVASPYLYYHHFLPFWIWWHFHCKVSFCRFFSSQFVFSHHLKLCIWNWNFSFHIFQSHLFDSIIITIPNSRPFSVIFSELLVWFRGIFILMPLVVSFLYTNDALFPFSLLKLSFASFLWNLVSHSLGL